MECAPLLSARERVVAAAFEAHEWPPLTPLAEAPVPAAATLHGEIAAAATSAAAASALVTVAPAPAADDDAAAWYATVQARLAEAVAALRARREELLGCLDAARAADAAASTEEDGRSPFSTPPLSPREPPPAYTSARHDVADPAVRLQLQLLHAEPSFEQEGDDDDDATDGGDDADAVDGLAGCNAALRGEAARRTLPWELSEGAAVACDCCVAARAAYLRPRQDDLLTAARALAHEAALWRGAPGAGVTAASGGGDVAAAVSDDVGTPVVTGDAHHDALAALLLAGACDSNKAAPPPSAADRERAVLARLAEGVLSRRTVARLDPRGGMVWVLGCAAHEAAAAARAAGSRRQQGSAPAPLPTEMAAASSSDHATTGVPTSRTSAVDSPPRYRVRFVDVVCLVPVAQPPQPPSASTASSAAAAAAPARAGSPQVSRSSTFDGTGGDDASTVATATTAVSLRSSGSSSGDSTAEADASAVNSPVVELRLPPAAGEADGASSDEPAAKPPPRKRKRHSSLLPPSPPSFPLSSTAPLPLLSLDAGGSGGVARGRSRRANAGSGLSSIVTELNRPLRRRGRGGGSDSNGDNEEAELLGGGYGYGSGAGSSSDGGADGGFAASIGPSSTSSSSSSSYGDGTDVFLPPSAARSYGGGFTADDAVGALMRQGYCAPVQVVALPGRGRCVFAAGAIPKGALVCEYIGQLVDGAEGNRRHAIYGVLSSAAAAAAAPPPASSSSSAAAADAAAAAAASGALGCYVFFFVHSGRQHCLDATAERRAYGVGRIISHSRRAPNCAPRVFVVDGVPRVALLARRDIAPGDELTYDYGERSGAVMRKFAWLASS